MNICFVMNEEYAELEKPFLEYATSQGMLVSRAIALSADSVQAATMLSQ